MDDDGGPEPSVSGATDAEIEFEVAHLVRGLVQITAVRNFVEENAELYHEVEELQRRIWLQEERTHHTRFPATRSLGAHVAITGSATPAGRPRVKPALGSEATANLTRPRRRTSQKMDGATDAALADLQKRLDLSIATIGSATIAIVDKGGAASSSGGAHSAVASSGGAGSGGSSGTSSSSRRTRGGGTKPSHTGPVAPCGSGFASCAESLLPTTPARSQFSFELPNPLNMHSRTEEDRHLQRRLSVLAATQAETIKLERKQRADGRAANMFYKLQCSDQASGVPPGANPSAPPSRFASHTVNQPHPAYRLDAAHEARSTAASNYAAFLSKGGGVPHGGLYSSPSQ